MEIEFTVNGKIRQFDVEPNVLLLNLIRGELHLTGTKYGCGIGECGACTVHVDKEPVLACLTLAVDVEGKEVETHQRTGKKYNFVAILKD